jgi:hypothetical protein
MSQSNSTLSTCQAEAGSLPFLQHPMSCGTSKYDKGNATIGESVLTSCCAGNPVAEFGNGGLSNCWVSKLGVTLRIRFRIEANHWYI